MLIRFFNVKIRLNSQIYITYIYSKLLIRCKTNAGNSISHFHNFLLSNQHKIRVIRSARTCRFKFWIRQFSFLTVVWWIPILSINMICYIFYKMYLSKCAFLLAPVDVLAVSFNETCYPTAGAPPSPSIGPLHIISGLQHCIAFCLFIALHCRNLVSLTIFLFF